MASNKMFNSCDALSEQLTKFEWRQIAPVQLIIEASTAKPERFSQKKVYYIFVCINQEEGLFLLLFFYIKWGRKKGCSSEKE